MCNGSKLPKACRNVSLNGGKGGDDGQAKKEAKPRRVRRLEMLFTMITYKVCFDESI